MVEMDLIYKSRYILSPTVITQFTLKIVSFVQIFDKFTPLSLDDV